MSKIDRAVEAFIAVIMDTEEYKEYDAQRNRVKQFPELKAQIDDYRTRKFLFQTREDTTFEQINDFEREFEDFREKPLVSDFLEAELAFCRLIQSINTRITEAVHFE